MIKKNIGKLILTSVVILLPIIAGVILWDSLPGILTTHWNASGEGDGAMGKAFAVFGVPVLLLAFHWICVGITAADPKNKEQTNKAFGMVLWIVPILSVLISAVMYTVAMGVEFNIGKVLFAVIGLGFILMGNYMPKCKQNNTIGIKLPWTLGDEENWRKTHRVAGAVWVVGGIAILLGSFLVADLTNIIYILLPIILLLGVIPTVYSYALYKKEGTKAAVKNPRYMMFSVIAGVVILALVAVLMFTGNVSVECKEESFTVDATYWSQIEVNYDSVDSIELREDFDGGERTYGWGSARLLLGSFTNEEFGVYTRYTYTGDKSCIVISSEGKTLVIGCKTDEETKALYETLYEKIK